MTSRPKRIQRKRERGWRKPPNTVCVTRPSKWGNPYVIGTHCETAAQAVELYKRHFLKGFIAQACRRELRGKDLACFCPLDQPCHADELLETANRGEVER